MEDQYRQRIAQDVKTARDLLSAHGIRNSLFAYPYGEYNRIVVEEVKKLGYDILFSQNPGVTWRGADRNRLDRMAIVGENISLAEFKNKLTRLPLGARMLEPRETVWRERGIEGIRVQLTEPSAYLDGQINLFLSEKGRLPARYDSVTGELVFRDFITLERPLNRIIVTAMEKSTGRFGFMSWLLLKEDAGGRLAP